MPLDNISEKFALAVIEMHQQLLQSIRQHGLLPLSKIPNAALSIPMTSTSTIMGNICVNFVDLTGGPSPKEIRTICQTLALEEYTGVGGISLERGWPLVSATPVQAAYEIQQRLINVCVFIVETPTIVGYTQELSTDSVVKTCCYLDDDGLSVERGHCITGGEQPIKTQRVVEVKTQRGFPLKDVRAILVPEALSVMVEHIFQDTGLEIIPVKLNPLIFRRMPETTTILHNQGVQSQITCTAPDYQQAFMDYIAKNPKANFAVHAVRLPTIYDVELRYVRDIVASQSLLERTAASSLLVYPDNSAWCAVPKQFAFSRGGMIQWLRSIQGAPDEVEFYQQLAANVEIVNKHQEKQFERYKSAVADYKMCRYKGQLYLARS